MDPISTTDRAGAPAKQLAEIIAVVEREQEEAEEQERLFQARIVLGRRDQIARELESLSVQVARLQNERTACLLAIAEAKEGNGKALKDLCLDIEDRKPMGGSVNGYATGGVLRPLETAPSKHPVTVNVH